jgi:hypothetical protein
MTAITTQTNSPPRSPWQQWLYDRYGSWALVTGATSGIGREIAIQLAAAGFNLIVVGRDRIVLAQMERELSTEHAIEVRPIACDLASSGAVAQLLADIGNLADVGLLVASAGFGAAGSFLDIPLKREVEMLEVNCRSLMELTWHCGRKFAQQGRGGMVLISSIVGFQGAPYAAHYAATKAYIQTLAEGLHVELAGLGIDVLACAPGPTHSKFAQRAGMEIGMALDPKEVARDTLRALGRQSVVLPGWISKLIIYGMLPLPRWFRVKMMGGVMKSIGNRE